MKTLLLFIVLVLLAGPRFEAAAETVRTYRVIVHPKNPASKLDRRFVSDVFLKKRTRWRDDSMITPVDLGPKSSVRGAFSEDVLDRSVAAVRRYWTQLVFSGRGVPPPELATDADVVKYVSAHAGAIGYVSGSAEVTGTKVIVIE
jgi:ABC-type phosphate transport system substrate-binding protein